MSVKLTGEKIEDLLFCDIKPVAELRLVYPRINGHITRTAETAFNSFYMNNMRKTNRYVRTVFFGNARARYLECASESFPFNIHSFYREYTATYIGDRTVSLYTDTSVYTGGAHPETTRTAQTWDLIRAQTVALGSFFKKGFNYRHYIISRVISRINDEDVYFSDAKRLAASNFDASRFYMTSENEITVWYPEYLLAPHYTGISTFTVTLP